MKKILFLLFALIITLTAISQGIIENSKNSYKFFKISSTKSKAFHAKNNTSRQYTSDVQIIASPQYGKKPLTVDFNLNKTENFAQFQWYFGDGEKSNELNPSHVYNAVGEYKVSLKYTNNGIQDSANCKNLITVYDLPTDDTLDINIIPGDSMRLIMQHSPPFNVGAVTVRTSWGPYYDPIEVINDSITVNPESNGLWAYDKFLLDADAVVGETYFKNFALIYWSYGYQNMAEYNYNYRIHAVSDPATNNKLMSVKDDMLQLYPNPANKYFMINFTSGFNYNFSVYIKNEIGQTVLERKKIPVYLNQIRVNTNDWSKGIYFVSAHSGNKIFRKKIIVR